MLCHRHPQGGRGAEEEGPQGGGGGGGGGGLAMETGAGGAAEPAMEAGRTRDPQRPPPPSIAPMENIKELQVPAGPRGGRGGAPLAPRGPAAPSLPGAKQRRQLRREKLLNSPPPHLLLAAQAASSVPGGSVGVGKARGGLEGRSALRSDCGRSCPAEPRGAGFPPAGTCALPRRFQPPGEPSPLPLPSAMVFWRHTEPEPPADGIRGHSGVLRSASPGPAGLRLKQQWRSGPSEARLGGKSRWFGWFRRFP